jgi:hypothetical protein
MLYVELGGPYKVQAFFGRKKITHVAARARVISTIESEQYLNNPSQDKY